MRPFTDAPRTESDVASRPRHALHNLRTAGGLRTRRRALTAAMSSCVTAPPSTSARPALETWRAWPPSFAACRRMRTGFGSSARACTHSPCGADECHVRARSSAGGPHRVRLLERRLRHRRARPCRAQGPWAVVICLDGNKADLSGNDFLRFWEEDSAIWPKPCGLPSDSRYKGTVTIHAERSASYPVTAGVRSCDATLAAYLRISHQSRRSRYPRGQFATLWPGHRRRLRFSVRKPAKFAASSGRRRLGDGRLQQPDALVEQREQVGGDIVDRAVAA